MTKLPCFQMKWNKSNATTTINPIDWKMVSFLAYKMRNNNHEKCVKLAQVQVKEIGPHGVEQCIWSQRITISDNPINENRWKLDACAHCVARNNNYWLGLWKKIRWWNVAQTRFICNQINYELAEQPRACAKKTHTNDDDEEIIDWISVKSVRRHVHSFAIHLLLDHIEIEWCPNVK